MITEVSNNAWTYFKEKASSPLYRTLIVAWCLWNWRILYLTFFIDEKSILPLTKLQYISTYYKDDWINYYWPLASTLAALFVFPFIENGVYKFTLNRRKVRLRAKVLAEDDLPISRDEAAKLKKQIRESAVTNQLAIDEKLAVIQSLNVELTAANEMVDRVKKNNSNSMKVLQTEMAKRKSELEVLEINHKSEILALELEIQELKKLNQSRITSLPASLKNEVDRIRSGFRENILIEAISMTNNGVLNNKGIMVNELRKALSDAGVFQKRSGSEYILSPIGCLIALQLYNENKITPSVYQIAINGF